MARTYIALLLSGLIAIDGVAAMHPVQAQKVERFKQRIDFDHALQAENRSEAVRAVWPDPLVAPGLGAGWSVADDTTWRTDGGIAREWILRRANETLSILIFVAQNGVRPAREFFLLRASENMMADVPYVKGPSGLGTLAVHLPDPQAPTLIWVYRNTAFNIYARNTSLDIVPIAKWLQAIADSGLVAATAAQLRAPGTLNVSTRRATVGQTIDISVDVPPTVQEAYEMRLEFEPQLLQLVSQHGLAAQVRGKAPGRAALDLYLIELNTLRSMHSRIELEFTAPAR